MCCWRAVGAREMSEGSARDAHRVCFFAAAPGREDLTQTPLTLWLSRAADTGAHSLIAQFGDRLFCVDHAQIRAIGGSDGVLGGGDNGDNGIDGAGGRPTRARRGRGAEGGTDSDVGEAGQAVDEPAAETKGRGTKRRAPDGGPAASLVTFAIDSPDTSPEPDHSDSDGEDPDETEEDKKGSVRAWRQSVMQLWNQIAENKNANLFRHPVNPKKVEGYDAVVYRPMDLATIKKNIETGVYTTIRDVEHDILLMFSNALMFNATGEFM